MRRRSLWLVFLCSLLWIACSTKPRHAEPAQRTFAFHSHSSGFRADNPTFGFQVRADATRVGLVGAAADQRFDFGMRLVRIAGEDVAPATPTADGTRLTFARAGSTEWYEHGSEGLEQGFDISRRVTHAGTLDVELAIDGLTPRIVDQTTVELQDARGETRLRYGKLHAVDARGIALDCSLSVTLKHIVLHVHDAGAMYPIAIDPLVWGVQTAYVATGGNWNGEGQFVALDGDTLVQTAICSPDPTTQACDPRGAAHVYVRNGTAWPKQATILAFDKAAEVGGFGSSVALSGNTLVVGAPRRNNVGSAHVYVRSGTAWTHEQTLTRPVGTPATNDHFGASVAIDGNTIIVGANSVTVAACGGCAETGSAYVFTRSGTTWAHQQELGYPPPYTGLENHGTAVAISGDWAVVTSAFSTWQGMLHFYKRTGTSWAFVHRIDQSKDLKKAPDATTTYLGQPLSLKGDVLAVGSKNWNQIGAALVFQRNPTTNKYEHQVTIESPDPVAGQNFGGSVAYENSTLVIGNLNGFPAHAYVYLGSGTTWTESQARLVPTGGGGWFGRSAAISNNRIAITSPLTPGAFVFERAKANGDGCAAASECVSNFCIDGVCCDTACTGLCAACTVAKTKSGKDGACGSIADGDNPDLDCPGSTTCTGVTQNNGFVCDGNGACRPNTTTACAPYVCGTAQCLITCSKDEECDAASWCDGAACVARKAVGASCTDSHECADGKGCVDGVCCSTACDGACEACSAVKSGVPGTNGTCTPVADGRDPDDNCAGSTCLEATFTEQVCDGAKGCRGKTTSCAPFACDVTGTICASSCTKDEDCGTAGFCAADKKCATRKAQGSACEASAECAVSLTCVDGVCCNSPCEGQCQACDVAPNVGQCVPVTGAPHGSKRAACASGASGCGGSCNGADALACTYPDVHKSCGDGCLNDSVSTCDGKGSCQAPAACAGSLTCASATDCRTTCAADTDCIAGYFCTPDHTCQPRTNACSADRKQSIDRKGVATGCAPVLCDTKAGICGSFCQSESDCVSGTTCDSTGTCASSSDVSGGGTGGSGGCSTSSRPSSPAAAALVLFALLLRRKKRATASDHRTRSA